MENLEKLFQGETSFNHSEKSMTISWLDGKVKLVVYNGIHKALVLVNEIVKVEQNDNNVSSIKLLERQCCEVVRELAKTDLARA
ncbi:MAG: hypothetical protein MJ003_04895 [Paludibacteraceae bacterium]|nr:hypothetical protein [Paludibacteraceae bacterium]